MRIEYDWLMSQIQLFVLAIARVVFNKGSIEYTSEDGTVHTQTDMLHRVLLDMVRERKLCEAENLLFEKLDTANRDTLVFAVDFYQELNRLPDEELEKGDFTREEISDGLHEVLNLFGIVIPGFE